MPYADPKAQKAYHTEYRIKNKDRLLAQVKVVNKRKKKEIKEFLTKVKNKSVCKLCGEAENACLDFHHIDAGTKEFHIAEAPKLRPSLDTLKKELAKCIVLCSNCHRKLHAGVVTI